MTPRLGRARRGAIAAVVLLVALVPLLAAACAGPGGSTSSPTPAPDADAIGVVTTTSVFADLVWQVGGARVRVHSLVPKGGEVHTFDPTPSDVEAIAGAKVVFANGLGLDDWLTGLVADAGTTATVVRLGEALDGVTYLEGEGGAGSRNPHLWLDVAYAAKYVDRIEAALSAADPADTAAFAANAAAYRTRLADLDGGIRARLAAIPAADRVVVSFHDAFPYFAAAYGLTIVGTVVDAPGQDPSAGEVLGLVDEIRASGAKAMLAEAQFNAALARAIAEEAGVALVTDLYDDTLGQAPADTYVGAMTTDAERVATALEGGG